MIRDFFQVKQAPLNYLLVLIFIGLDFLPLVLSGKTIIPTWYLPIILFVKGLTHALINSLSQLSSVERIWLLLVIKVLIILLAMRIASSSMEKAKS